MKIGVDIDGVLIDFYERLRYRAEIFNCTERDKNKVEDSNNYWVQVRYGFSNEEWTTFCDKYLLELTKESCFKPGAEEVLKMLKQDGHELIVISTRGTEFEEMITLVEEKINNSEIKFDKYYWKNENKVETCKKEKIDIMIDDDLNNCKKMSENGINTFYFRNIYGMQLLEQNNLQEVHDWAEIYRLISTYSRN